MIAPQQASDFGLICFRAKKKGGSFLTQLACRMDRCYHRAAYEHHRAKAAVYRSKAEGHLARASAHRSRLGFGTGQCGCVQCVVKEGPCPCGCNADMPCPAQVAFAAATTHDKLRQADKEWQERIAQIDRIDVFDPERKRLFRRKNMLQHMKVNGLAYFRANAEKVPSSLELDSAHPPPEQDRTWRQLLSEMFGISI